MSKGEFGDIVQVGHEALSKIAPDVPVGEITSNHFQSIIKRMHTALAATDDGVALAAPQIGESHRIFIISPRIFEEPEGEPLVYINPKIIKTSRKRKWVDEGCLSVRWKYGKTNRHEKATVTALSEKGEPFQRQGSGLLAQIFQHEIDHLDGVLFTDHAKDIHDYNPKEIRNHEH